MDIISDTNKIATKKLGNVSHMLNVIISQSTTKDIADEILQQVFHKINNVPIMFTINNIDVVITWHINDISNYNTDVMGIYGDVAVSLHTEMLLKMVDMYIYDRKDILSFIVTKPLVHTIPL